MFPSLLYIMGLIDSRLCGSCRAEKETSLHVLCECGTLATLRHAYLFAFFVDPEDVVGPSLGAVWKLIKKAELP